MRMSGESLIRAIPSSGPNKV
ncbi:protein of unknown function [Pararobbsia alpina]